MYVGWMERMREAQGGPCGGYEKETGRSKRCGRELGVDARTLSEETRSYRKLKQPNKQEQEHLCVNAWAEKRPYRGRQMEAEA